MVTENYERALRRLVEHERKLQTGVGLRVSGLSVRLWRWLVAEGSGALCCKVAAGGPLNLMACERIARGALGRDLVRAAWRYEDFDARGTPHARLYARPLYGHETVDARLLAEIRVPAVVRWFAAERLAAGIGHDGGRVTFGRFGFEPVAD